MFRESLIRNLQDAGFGVTAFGDSESALDYFRKGGTADLALFDWKLPEMSGIELFQRILGLLTDLVLLGFLRGDLGEIAIDLRAALADARERARIVPLYRRCVRVQARE